MTKLAPQSTPLGLHHINSHRSSDDNEGKLRVNKLDECRGCRCRFFLIFRAVRNGRQPPPEERSEVSVPMWPFAKTKDKALYTARSTGQTFLFLVLFNKQLLPMSDLHPSLAQFQTLNVLYL